MDTGWQLVMLVDKCHRLKGQTNNTNYINKRRIMQNTQNRY